MFPLQNLARKELKLTEAWWCVYTSVNWIIHESGNDSVLNKNQAIINQ